MTLPSYRVRFAHLVAVWGYAVCQPIFSMLDDNPEFLAIRGSTRFEIVVFAAALTLGAPLLAVLAEWLVSLVSHKAGDVLHLVFLGLFVTPLALFLLKQLDPGPTVAVVAAAAGGVAIAVAYLRWRQVRTFLTVSLVLPVIGFALFVTDVPVVVDDAAGARLHVSSEVPVVVFVLDEFPTSSLLTSKGRIDAVRYPNFARLARDATWYAGATTVHEFTPQAVPAILTGRFAEPGQVPTLADYPDNLFTLLGESYRLRVHETVTYLCPKRYCPRHRDALPRRLSFLFSDLRVAFLHRVLPNSLAEGLPSLGDRWSGFGRDALLVADDGRDVFDAVAGRDLSVRRQFNDFLQEFSPDNSARTLYFVHVALPHSPWRYLPSGHEYLRPATIDWKVTGSNRRDNPWLVEQAYRRHLLQVGYADKLVGRLHDRLVGSGLWNDALVVVTADHGVSFVVGRDRRVVSRETFADIVRVPLFVKYPGQRNASVESRVVQTVDILPTIADVLGIRLPWAVDGQSLIGTPSHVASVTVISHDGFPVRATPREIELGMTRTIRRKTALFGEGSDSLFRSRVSPELIGLPVAVLRRLNTVGARVHLDDEALLSGIRVPSWVTPALITGTIDEPEIGTGQRLAVAVNGRVAGTARSFEVDGEERFSFLVPPTAFRDGPNRIEVFIIGTDANRRLVRLGPDDYARH